MTVLIDKKKNNDTGRLRLTIHIDLSGFSFKVCDSSNVCIKSYAAPFRSDFLSINGLEPYLKRELISHPILGNSYSDVNVFFDTEKYCFVPNAFFRENEAETILGKLHNLNEKDKLQHIQIEEQGAVLIYTVPEMIYSNVSSIQPEAHFYPNTYRMLQRIPAINENNKVLVHFSENIVHIVVAEKNRLLIANSFPAPDFVTAEYYIFLVMKEVCFNPESTILQISGPVSRDQENALKKYFKGTSKFTC